MLHKTPGGGRLRQTSAELNLYGRQENTRLQPLTADYRQASFVCGFRKLHVPFDLHHILSLFKKNFAFMFT